MNVRSRLRVDDRPVAGEQLRIELPHHRRAVERQVGRAVAVAGGIRANRTNDTRRSSPGPNSRTRREERCDVGAYVTYCSSAVGP